MNILAAMADPKVFGAHFRDKDSWKAWEAFLAALFALPMSPYQADTFRAHTGRAGLPEQPFSEAWLCCGRRSGKSFMLSVIATYLAS
jgi:hypothetical protein